MTLLGTFANAFSFPSRQYELCVLETKPGPAIDIHECDLNVEFAAPVGYQEPEVSSLLPPCIQGRIL